MQNGEEAREERAYQSQENNGKEQEIEEMETWMLLISSTTTINVSLALEFQKLDLGLNNELW